VVLQSPFAEMSVLDFWVILVGRFKYVGFWGLMRMGSVCHRPLLG
jgi:hypothetical protein